VRQVCADPDPAAQEALHPAAVNLAAKRKQDTLQVPVEEGAIAKAWRAAGEFQKVYDRAAMRCLAAMNLPLNFFDHAPVMALMEVANSMPSGSACAP
jgi:hypothetical protein